MSDRPWTCPDCGTVGINDPTRLPLTEFATDQLGALHQWARFFDQLTPTTEHYTAVDFIHWVLADHRLHSHARRRNEPAGRPNRIRLEARGSAA